MYLMYVDESGDTGLDNSPTRYFCLSGIVLHESNWRNFIDRLIVFRKAMKSIYGLPIRQEIHASEFITGKPINLPRHERLAILRNGLDELADTPFLSVTTVVVDKQGKPATYDVFNNAWGTLFQRFENTLRWGNFPGGHRNDFGLVITDATSGKKLDRLMRKMSVFNYIPHDRWYGSGSRNVPITKIIEDPIGRDSRNSLPIQMVDIVAYFAKQIVAPNSFIKTKNAKNYYKRLHPIINVYATRKNKLGIVLL
jgi:hypothetical protein